MDVAELQKSYDLYGTKPFSTKMRSSCSKNYKIEYKATVMVFVIIVHKYKESNVDFNIFLNCCETWQLCCHLLDHSICVYL